MENLKKMAGIKAAEFVNDGMVVGLGTGSTAYYFVEEIGRRIKEEGLQITAVTTSSVTSKQAEGLNIPLKSIDQVDFVDVTVDGQMKWIVSLTESKAVGVPFSWRRLWQRLKRIHLGGG